MIKVGGLSFSDALTELKAGQRTYRKGWNRKGMWIALCPPSGISDMDVLCIYMSTTQSNLVPWTASQIDLLAEDWYVF